MMTKKEVNRLKHCYAEGYLLYWLCKNHFHFSKEYSARMFMLGWCHDMMYEFETDNDPHHEIISRYVPTEFSEIIREHSCQPKKGTPFQLRLLYFVDATVDGSGKYVGYQGRINDLIKRHSNMSQCENILNYLKQYEELNILEEGIKGFEIDIPIDKLKAIYENAKNHSERNPQKFYELMLRNGIDDVFKDELKDAALYFINPWDYLAK